MTQARDNVRLARDLAEAIYASYAQRAADGLHPQHEQTLLTRLAEALEPALAADSAEQAVAAGNRALAAFEQNEPDLRGPRIAALDIERATATLSPSSSP